MKKSSFFPPPTFLNSRLLLLLKQFKKKYIYKIPSKNLYASLVLVVQDSLCSISRLAGSTCRNMQKKKDHAKGKGWAKRKTASHYKRKKW